LRVNGKGRLTTDPALLKSRAVTGRTPQSALVIAVEKAFFHCGRALIRSRLWETETHAPPGVLPSLGQMLADQIAGVDVVDAEARLERANATLWGEPISPVPAN
jgi:predicted pyridoxine 5'-phosphate oxidase superfamily flavin-nucleotide-binding protein